ncbi:site-specific integrase [Eggerthella sinensis]|uniref:site-specific integrase n=1 Tax=Eggerthella sinensis TaxID=242230 RepID=UPI0022E63FDD|nr:site-specific integrase [Eggerthella sinensis]
MRKLNSELAAIFNHAAKNYDLDPNPVKKVKKTGKQRADEMKIWSKAEFDLFLDAVCDKAASYYAFEILYWTGIREGELLAITPADFDFENCYLDISKSVYRRGGEDIVGPPKTEKSYRRFRIPRFLAEEVEEYIRLFLHIADDERIFEGLTRKYLCNEMDRGCKIAGVKRIRVHDLRHSHVSILIDMGYSATDIANRVGHESIDITYRYAHLFPNSQQSMAARLQDAGSQRRCVQEIEGCPI